MDHNRRQVLSCARGIANQRRLLREQSYRRQGISQGDVLDRRARAVSRRLSPSLRKAAAQAVSQQVPYGCVRDVRLVVYVLHLRLCRGWLKKVPPLHM